MSHLSSGKINVSILRDDARQSLIEFFLELEGSKTLYWERSLMAPFNLIIDYASLKGQNVTRMLEFNNDTQLQGITTQHVVFLMKGDIASVESVARIVKEQSNSSPGRCHHVILVPRGALICDQVFTDYGILGDFQAGNSIMELPVIYPLDHDILSLEMQSSFFRHFVEEDNNMIFDTASAIMHIQSLYGVIPVVRGVGKAARKVFDVMTRLKDETDDESAVGDNLGHSSRIDYLFILDRSVDLVTPLLCQMSYEGLIDEFFGIKNASAKFPPEKFSTQESPEKTSAELPAKKESEKVNLNSGEELFSKLRDKNFEAVGPFITTTTKRLASLKTETGQARSIKELKEIMDKLPYYDTAKKSVAKHVAIAELLRDKLRNEDCLRRCVFEQDLVNLRDYDLDYLEELIYQNKPLNEVLRLVCLLSLTKGLKKSPLDVYRKELIQSYGIEILPTLLHLETAGLLKASTALSYLPGSQTPYCLHKKNLQLTDPRFKEKFDPQSPNCFHPYDGYVPLSVRLAEKLFKTGVADFSEVTRAIIGTIFEEIQTHSRTRFNSTASSKSAATPEEGKTVLVVFLGGCTYSEVSCLRLLSQQEDMNADFVTLTTEFIRGKSLMSQFTQHLVSDAQPK